MVAFTTKQLDAFQKAANSLKLFSRAELNDEKNRSLVEKLYVDPLPNEQVFKTLLADNTTIIVGRKGTGKSTVFQRVQHEIRKNRAGAISAYMDIRNVYEASQIDPLITERISALESAMSPDQIQKFLLYKRFFKVLISDIRTELKAQVDQNFLTRLRERMIGSSQEVFSELDALIKRLDAPDYENIVGVLTRTRKDNSNASASLKESANAEANVNASNPNLKASAASEHQSSEGHAHEDVYTELMMRVLGVNDFIDALRSILNALGIRSLYIFLDDFSEMPREAMHLLVDALISPLARWSEFIKFKIAAYPGRVYLGDLDKTKIEEIDLDMYGLYGASGVNKMEEKALDFVRRVVEKRIAYFCRAEATTFFSSAPDIWRTLFYASMANPRILGHILLYAHEGHLIYGSQIGIQSLQEASQRYYEEKIAPFFSSGKYRLAFEERSSIFSLKELLESIVKRARSIRQEGSREAGSSRSRTYSSHLYVNSEYDDLFLSLELSFFITKYFEQSDRNGARVSIYALNYGLCMKYQIGFGRPTERREDRLYFVDRRFDYNGVARSYMRTNQEVKCDGCGKEFELDMLPALKMLHMECPNCRVGTCRVVNLSRKYGDMLEAISPELLLPDTELGILQTLNSEDRTMFAAEIAGELDCSGQLVGRRAKNLSERSLVTRANSGAVFKYTLTDEAREAYFEHEEDDELDV